MAMHPSTPANCQGVIYKYQGCLANYLGDSAKCQGVIYKYQACLAKYPGDSAKCQGCLAKYPSDSAKCQGKASVHFLKMYIYAKSLTNRAF